MDQNAPVNPAVRSCFIVSVVKSNTKIARTLAAFTQLEHAVGYAKHREDTNTERGTYIEVIQTQLYEYPTNV